MNTALAVLLTILSFNAIATDFTFSVPPGIPATDTDGLVITDSDIAFFTFKCGSATGVYDSDKLFQTAGRDNTGVLLRSVNASFSTVGTVTWFCAVSATGQYTDGTGQTQLRAESADGAETTVNVPPGALNPPGKPQVIRITVIVN